MIKVETSVYQAYVLQDIINTVQRALTQHLDPLDEAALLQQSDACLPDLLGRQGLQGITTAGLLRRYDVPLHKILAWAGSHDRGASRQGVHLAHADLQTPV